MRQYKFSTGLIAFHTSRTKRILQGISALIILLLCSVSAHAQGPILGLNVKAELNDIAWSPDAQLLAVAGDWGIRLFTSALRETGSIVVPDDAAILALSWRPDGLQLAGGSAQGTVYVWDRQVKTDRLTLAETLATNHKWVSCVAWSPDGTRLAVLGMDQPIGYLDPLGTGEVWDAADWRVITTLPAPLVAPMERLAWSSDGTRIAGGGNLAEFTTGCAACEYGTLAYIADATTGEAIQSINSLAFGDLAWHASQRLAVIDIGFMLFDTSNGLATPMLDEGLEVHQYYRLLEWSPDGSLLAAASLGFGNILDPATGAVLTDNLVISEGIAALDWHPSEPLLAVAHRQGRIELYDVGLALEALPPE